MALTHLGASINGINQWAVGSRVVAVEDSAHFEWRKAGDVGTITAVRGNHGERIVSVLWEKHGGKGSDFCEGDPSTDPRRYLKSAATTGNIHEHAAYCNNCYPAADNSLMPCRNIMGVRYKCSTCPDFDLCEICLLTNEQRGGRVHDPSHLFLRIVNPSTHIPTPAGNKVIPQANILVNPLLLPIQPPLHPMALAPALILPLAAPALPAVAPATPSRTFGDRLAALLAAENKGTTDVVLSPLSIEYCCLLVANGAQGQTQSEIVSMLDLGTRYKDMKAVNASYSDLIKSLLPTVVITNSVWTKSKDFDQQYTQTVLSYYSATARLARSVNDINAWVSEATRGKIPSVLQGPLPETVLVNCIYLKADWEKPFTKSSTTKQPFFVPNRPPIDVAMMRNAATYKYLRSDGFEAIALPYSNAKLWAVVVLPSPHVNISTLPSFSDAFSALLSQPSKHGTVYLPKFRSEYSCDLVSTLQAAGMRAAFSHQHQMQNRDFAPMLADKHAIGLYIQKCIHKVFVDVDEKGTEAAAVTAAMSAFGAVARAPQPEFEFRCDRPFKFYICTSDAFVSHPGRVVFQGDIYNPTTYVEPPRGVSVPDGAWQRQQPTHNKQSFPQHPHPQGIFGFGVHAPGRGGGGGGGGGGGVRGFPSGIAFK